jgi:hypothetical protein
MPRDFFDPTPEQQNVILVDGATLREAEKLIAASPAIPKARLSYDNIRDRVTGSNPTVTDYVLEERRCVPSADVRS